MKCKVKNMAGPSHYVQPWQSIYGERTIDDGIEELGYDKWAAQFWCATAETNSALARSVVFSDLSDSDMAFIAQNVDHPKGFNDWEEVWYLEPEWVKKYMVEALLQISSCVEEFKRNPEWGFPQYSHARKLTPESINVMMGMSFVDLGREDSRCYAALEDASWTLLADLHNPGWDHELCSNGYEDYWYKRHEYLDAQIYEVDVMWLKDNIYDLLQWVVNFNNESQKYAKYARHHIKQYAIDIMLKQMPNDEAIEQIAKQSAAQLFYLVSNKKIDLQPMIEYRSLPSCPV